MNDKLIKLPKQGRLMVVSDLHGNLKDYESYINLWDMEDSDFHIVFLGDLIHSPYFNDKSIEILDDVIEKDKEYSNFHALLGNHEWAHITHRDIYKNGENIREEFEHLVSYKKGFIEPSITEYIKFFKTMPYFVQTENGLFISHAGPSKKVKSIEDFNSIFDGDYNNQILDEFLWLRPKRNLYGRRHVLSNSNLYDEGDIFSFLDVVGSNCMVVGHSPVDGYKQYGNQLIISSSYETEDKVYLDIDLSKDIKHMRDLLDCIRYLD
ncbi:MAG: metallophosphoesterase [Methanobrevibacter sp.]|nr:metallophosphoesterase [Methanobrevibacter sp.]